MTWNTVSVLCMSQLGSSEWEIQNVFAVFQVGSLLVHCPFPCDVLAVFLVGTPPLVPSVSCSNLSRCLSVRRHAASSLPVTHLSSASNRASNLSFWKRSLSRLSFLQNISTSDQRR